MALNDYGKLTKQQKLARLELIKAGYAKLLANKEKILAIAESDLEVTAEEDEEEGNEPKVRRGSSMGEAYEKPGQDIALRAKYRRRE